MSKQKTKQMITPQRRLIYTYKYSLCSTTQSVKQKDPRIVFSHEFTVFHQPIECHAEPSKGTKHVFYPKDGWVIYGAQSSPSVDLRGKKIYLQGPQTVKDFFVVFSEEMVVTPDEVLDFIESAQQAENSLRQFDQYLRADDNNPIPNNAPEDLEHERFNSLEF